MVGFFLFFVSVYLLGCMGLAWAYLHPARIAYTRPDGVASVELPDGTPVWVTPGLANYEREAQTLFVLVHGYQGCRATWNEVIAPLAAEGYAVAVPALPNHDANLNRQCGFGVKESHVVLHLVDWARARFHAPPNVILVGVSMGGAAVWLASEKDDTVSAVITEGCFASLDETIKRWFNHFFPGGHFFLAPVVLFARIISRINPKTVRPVDAAAKWKGRPALVIHGEEDTLMPESNARRLAGAARCDLWIVPEASHAQCKVIEPEEYALRLIALARRVEGRA